MHSSATSVVWYALEVGDGRPVALKAMKNKDEFDREVNNDHSTSTAPCIFDFKHLINKKWQL